MYDVQPFDQIKLDLSKEIDGSSTLRIFRTLCRQAEEIGVQPELDPNSENDHNRSRYDRLALGSFTTRPNDLMIF